MTIHGTKAGFEKHKNAGVPICDDCKRAQADYQAHRRFITGRLTDPRRCRRCGSAFKEHQCSLGEE